MPFHLAVSGDIAPMRIDGLKIKEGSAITNLVIASGTTFPALPNTGELFYRTDGVNAGLHVYGSLSWNKVADSQTTQDGLGDKQPLDDELTAIAALVSATDKFPYFTGLGTAALATVTPFARNFLDDANDVSARATLGLIIGTNVQAFNANLSAIAGVTSAVNKLSYFTGSGTADVTDLTSFARTLIASIDAPAARTVLGAAATSHTHAIGDVTGLSTALANKAALIHVHSAADITTGTLVVARGGTGIASYTTGNFIRASGATTLEQRTAAQVLTDIGAAASAHNHSLDTLSNVTITANASGEILKWNGTAWINNTLAEAGVAAAVHTHVMSDVTDLAAALAGKANTSHVHSAADITSGTLGVDRGGTGATTFTAGQLLLGNGTTAVTTISRNGIDTRTTFPPDAHTHPGVYQPLDADLTAIAALAGTSGLLRKTSADAWTLDTASYSLSTHAHSLLTRGTYLTGANYDGTAAATWAVDATSANTASKVVARDASGNFAAGTITAALAGNATTATTATTLATGRLINGTSFNGSVDITTANWGTSRTITIGATGKAVNGSANVTWSIAEIGAIPSSEKGAVNGVATLDGAGLVPVSQLPSYVDDVLEFANLAGFPATGETGKIYVAIDNSKIYRWSGSVYMEISASAGNADTATTLATGRLINGTSFNGSADITTANWGTTRTITIGSTGKSVNGAASVSWSLAEMGAAPTVHVHSAADITSGTFAVARGGTGIASYTTGNYVRASAATTLEQRTPAQVLTDIGAAASVHVHSAADITSGTLAVARGGTGIASYTTGNFIYASGAATLAQRTPAQVLTDIGAAASVHVHAASAITSGTLAVARGGTGIASYTTGNYVRASGATTLEQRTPSQVLSDIGVLALESSHEDSTGTVNVLVGQTRVATGAVTYQMPVIDTNNSRIIILKRNGASAVNILRNTSQTFDGVADDLILDQNYLYVMLAPTTATNWRIVNRTS